MVLPFLVYVKERKDAHLLIEDFMLLANKEVARFIAEIGKATQREVPFVYRVHDTPNIDKVADLARFAEALDFELKYETPEQIAASYNRLAKAAQQDGALRMLEPLAIRTMAKAIYTTENIGHYGLGFDYYTHFTSPIRRYSDVLVHRVLEKNLDDVHRVSKVRFGGEVQTRICSRTQSHGCRTRIGEIQAGRVYGKTHRRSLRRYCFGDY